MAQRAGDGGFGRLLALGGVMAAVVLTYANTLDGELVFDARPLVLENPALREASLRNVWLALSRDYWQPLATDGLYRPLTTLSYLFNHAVLGNADRPFGYHVVNLLLHLACVATVYLLVRTLVARETPALVAAAVFGLHPVASEAVANVVGRADQLAALGVLGGLVCHVRARAARGVARVRWTVALGVAAIVAFFSKENGVVLVAAILLWELRGGERSWSGLVTVLAVAAIYVAARWAVARAGLPPDPTSPVDNPIVEAAFWSGRLTGLAVMGRELGLLVSPQTLSADYSYAQIPVVRFPPTTWPDVVPAPALMAILTLVAIAYRERRRAPLVSFFTLFVLVALLPTANVLTVIGSVMADRFLYLPLAGFAGLVGLLVERIARRGGGARRAVFAAIATILVAFSWRTVVRNADWRDERTLWAATVETAPASAKARKAYAAALFASDPQHRELARILAEAERAVAIRGDYTAALIDLGSYYVVEGDAVAAHGGDATPWYAKAVAVLERGRTLDVAANRRFAETMVATHHDAAGIPEIGQIELYQNLSLAYAGLGRHADALAAAERARQLQPSDPSRYVDVSAVLCNLGRWEEAAIALFQAVTIRPENRDAATRLVTVYQTFDPHGHEVVRTGTDAVTINLDDATVQRHRCEAFAGLARIYARANQPDASARAARLRERACGAAS